MKSPADCMSMNDIRAEIDQLDTQLVTMFAQRMRYIDRAAQIKQAAGLPARIPARVEEVVDNVARLAQAQGLDAKLYEKLWRDVIEWSIAHEELTLGKDGSDDGTSD